MEMKGNIKMSRMIEVDQAFQFVRDNFTAQEVFGDIVSNSNAFDEDVYSFISVKMQQNPDYLKRFLSENPTIFTKIL